MANKELTTFRMAPELMAAMRALREREGIPVAKQMDFAIRAWLKKRGEPIEDERAKPSTRPSKRGTR